MSAYSDKVILDGALFYWRLGESAGTTAVDQKGILNATHIGAVTVGQAGSILGDGDLSALYGPANARTEAPADTRHQTLTNWTVEAWVYRTGAPSNEVAIFTHVYVGGNLPFVLSSQVTSGNAYMGWYSGAWNYSSTTPLPLNAWVHLAATYDGTNSRFYKNGVLISTDARGALSASATSALRIGHRWDSSLSFPGRIDEVALYPTVLTPAQILDHYTLGTTAPPPQTVQVGGVYPSGFQASIVGRVTSGDGHVVGGKSLGTQFGTPTVTVKVVTLVAVGGVPSAAAFGTVTTAITRVPQTRAVVGLGSTQSFGVVTPKASITRTVFGLGSAQAFGALHVAITQTVGAGGVLSAQSFGAIKIVWSQTVQVPGLPQQTGLRSIVGGVVSGDGHLVGGSGLLFGFVTILPGRATVSLATLGLGSAQQFGVPHIAFWQPLSVLGVPSAQQFGTPLVYLVWVYDLPCADLDLAAISCTDLDLVTVTCDALTLATASTTTLDLTASGADDLDLQEAGCS